MKPSTRLLPQSKNRIKDPRKYLCQVFESFVRSYQIQDEGVSQLFGNLLSNSFGSAVKVAGTIGSQIYPDASKHLLMNQLASFVKKLPFEDASLQPEQALG